MLLSVCGLNDSHKERRNFCDRTKAICARFPQIILSWIVPFFSVCCRLMHCVYVALLLLLRNDTHNDAPSLHCAASSSAQSAREDGKALVLCSTTTARICYSLNEYSLIVSEQYPSPTQRGDIVQGGVCVCDCMEYIVICDCDDYACNMCAISVMHRFELHCVAMSAWTWCVILVRLLSSFISFGWIDKCRT